MRHGIKSEIVDIDANTNNKQNASQMGNMFSRFSDMRDSLVSGNRVHKIVVRRAIGSPPVSGFVERNNYTLDYFVSNSNKRGCTVEELLESVNAYRTVRIQNLRSAAEDGQVLDPATLLPPNATVWV